MSSHQSSTYAAGGVQEGDISEVGAIESDVSRVLDISLRARDHAALYMCPLAGERVPLDVGPQ